MTKNIGQQATVWDDWWEGITPISEIQMWDYYGGRQWIMKYVPRYGKIIEAGCGVGRFNFYLRKLGIDIEGLDFSEEVIKKLNKWKLQIDPEAKFILGDVTKLPYKDNSLSGYISLGVVEHFKEGPQKAIKEAYRVLRPGGIAIITTPNKSFLIRYRNFKKSLKTIVKKLIRFKIKRSPFFQYEYSPTQLKKHCQEQGFYVTRAEGCDMLYPFNEIGGFTGENLNSGSFAYWFASKFENTWLKKYGGQSITISVKREPLMYCFLSGKLNATEDSLDIFDVPISNEMQDTAQAQLFIKDRKVSYSSKYIINPPIISPEIRTCSISGKKYKTDIIFEDYGFSKSILPEILKDPAVNLQLSANSIKPVWRKRLIE